jgi:hypothetical protein
MTSTGMMFCHHKVSLLMPVIEPRDVQMGTYTSLTLAAEPEEGSTLLISKPATGHNN